MEEFEEEEVEYCGTVRITFTGHTLPHWRYEYVDGDRSAIEELVRKANAVIGFLPTRDPQFRRNRDRVQRDADREGITIEWMGAGIEDRDGPSGARDATPADEAAPSGT